MECKYCEKNDNCIVKQQFTKEEIGCSKGILTIKAQKELNAFQIIKEKEVDVSFLRITFITYIRNGEMYYNLTRYDDDYYLTQEEYDLLKEVLK